jgi:nicotinate phosphoribosyltransferase
LAGALYDIPLFGTMAHSFIQAHDDESHAFEHFARSHPDNTTLLIDTYDTEAAADKVVALAKKLKADNIIIKGVRLDSGDLVQHARNVRRILDSGGLHDVTIFASGNLDEYKLKILLAARAPIDGFGIGTALDISVDAPALDCAYKLQEFAGKPRRKRSEGKATWPGRKQVYRTFGRDSCMSGDTVALENGDPQQGTPLLQPFMHAGKRLHPKLSLHALRQQTLMNYQSLPAAMIAIDHTDNYPVTISSTLQALAARLDQERLKLDQ